ncbi:MAG: methyltransferase domain-containing protein [Chloroflexi bacterium]|nr:MAG: methyltransferase domain-containing protein [Chloroflexota bacterium]
MNWQTKAKIQNAIALLPSELSYDFYYRLQRKFGGLKQVNPMMRLKAGIDICQQMANQGQTPSGKTFLEVGTGRRLNIPIAFWLLGAEKVITVDLNPYLKRELVADDIQFIATHQPEIEQLFCDTNYDKDRLKTLCNLNQSTWNLPTLMQLCNFEYLAPGDATNLKSVSNQTVDIHTSFTVLEHIPPELIKGLLQEGNRILKNDGLFVHLIDHSDHFAHDDNSISTINFLQYSDKAWQKIAGNRYMYMNRLRVDDFEAIYHDCNQTILSIEAKIDQNAVTLLQESELNLHEPFASKPVNVLATSSSWIVSAKNNAQMRVS